MPRLATGGLLLAILATATFSVGISAQEATPVASAAIFTSAQAASGKSVYSRSCASCHGGSLEGTNDAPALSGKNFGAYWPGKTVAELYNYAHDNMPPTAPASLKEQEYLDIVAYILSANGHEAGETPLPSDVKALEALSIGG